MDEEHPLLREVHPDLVAELTALLEAEGEHALALQTGGLRLYGHCGCGDDFCQSLRTAPRPPGPYGPGHRNVTLTPTSGDLILDVVDDHILYIEILNDPPQPPAH
ncbi:hypothetical protein GCM10022221_50250 [Actinocorallia aurea]